jgi:hypothetical protein
VGGWFLSDVCTMRSGAAAMRICIFDADGDRVTKTERSVDLVMAKLSNDDSAFPHVELHTMSVP